MSLSARAPGRLPYRLASVAYLLAIVVPTLVLCYLGLSAIYQQREAINALSAVNQRLAAQRLVADIEEQAISLGEDCLHDASQAGIDLPDEFDSPGARRAVRARLEEVRARHPIARALVVYRNDTLVVPEPASAIPRSVPRLLAAEAPEARARFGALFADAEALEDRDGRPAEARLVYARASNLPVSADLRALALARAGRCQSKEADNAGAVRTYRHVLARFPDQYDLHNQPYGVVASIQLYDLAASKAGGEADILKQALRDVLQGRWELNAETAVYFRSELAARIGPGAAPPSGPYLEYLELAERLQSQARPPSGLKPGAAVPVAFSAGGEPGLVFYARLEGISRVSSDLVVGLVVDLSWVAGVLTADTGRRLQVAGPYRVTGRRPRAGASPATAAGAVVPFGPVFPFWDMDFPPRPAAAAGGTWLFAGATLAVLGVLVLGVVLLVRDASREAAMARLRSGFVSGVSHELKTPLTLIRMYGEMLDDDPDAPADERLVYSGIIRRESQRLTRLVDRVLDFSLAERGAKRYTLTPEDLAQLVRNTIAEYSPLLAQKDFDVEADIEDVGPIDADADAVREAIVNLLDNAAKYSGESRHISVRVGARPGAVTAEVRDRGIGMDDATRAHLFLPFRRGEHHDDTGGHGLGLYLVRQIMDAHGGSIEIESAPGHGSTVRLVFPVTSH